MSAENGIIIALTTVASRAEAEALAGKVLEERVAACVQIEGPIKSLYRWNDKTVKDEEYRILLKTTAASADALRDTILRHHPYETPFWASWEASSSPAYRAWLTEAVT